MTRYWFEDTATVEFTPIDDGGNPIDGWALDSTHTVTIDESPWQHAFETDTFHRFEATVTRPIEQTYYFDEDPVVLKKPEDELKESVWQLDNCPWTIEHPTAKRITAVDQMRGFWRNPTYEDGQQATLYVPDNDTEALSYVRDNEDVSIGFQASIDWVDEDDTIDGYQRGLVVDHVASVEKGRCPSEEGCGLHTDTAMKVLTDAIREGSWVQWNWSDGTAYGKVIETSEDDDLSAGSTTREPTEDRRAYKMVHWKPDMGEWGNTVVKLEGENDLSEWSNPPSSTPEMPMDGDGAHMEEEDYGGVRTERTETEMTTAASGEGMSMDPLEEAYVAATREEAQAIADMVGCDETHSHEREDGYTVYMPCADMDEMEEQIDGSHIEDDSGCSPGPCSCGEHVDDGDDSSIKVIVDGGDDDGSLLVKR